MKYIKPNISKAGRIPEGKMLFPYDLRTSSRGIHGCFRPYGMTKWLDDNKVNCGFFAVFSNFNDVYIDHQHLFFGKKIKPIHYLKIYMTEFGKLRIVPHIIAMEVSEDCGKHVWDDILWHRYIRIPKWLFYIVAPIVRKKYIIINETRN